MVSGQGIEEQDEYGLWTLDGCMFPPHDPDALGPSFRVRSASEMSRAARDARMAEGKAVSV